MFLSNSQMGETNADFEQEYLTVFQAQMNDRSSLSFIRFFEEHTPAPPHSGDWLPDIIPGWA